jgi:hypothetical protein
MRYLWLSMENLHFKGSTPATFPPFAHVWTSCVPPQFLGTDLPLCQKQCSQVTPAIESVTNLLVSFGQLQRCRTFRICHVMLLPQLIKKLYRRFKISSPPPKIHSIPFLDLRFSGQSFGQPLTTINHKKSNA